MPSAPRSTAVCRTCCNRLRPASVCSTFGRADFMRVPLPAAMITMSSAMLSVFRTFGLRSLIIGAVLALLGACSALRIGYGAAPDLVYWWLDGYVDFDDTQTPRVREAIGQ